MKITINRNYCGHHPASCERCFGTFLQQGQMTDWPCLTGQEDDGRPEIEVHLTSGEYTTTFVVDESNRQEFIYNGYIRLIDLPPEAYEIVPPHGDDIRRMQRAEEKDI